jgi:hypothetical protein
MARFCSRGGGAMLGCLVATVVAACGSGSSSSSSTHAASTTTTTRTTTVTHSPSPSQSASATSSATRAARTAHAAAAGCTPARTKVSLGGGSAGLGHAGEVVLFTNTGPSSCTLVGYPGAALVSATGRHGLLNIARTPQGYLGGLSPSDKVDPVISLRPGERASALLEGEDSSAPSGGPCPRYEALLVTPPNQTVTVRLDQTFQICNPQIHPVVSGTSGRQSS